MTTYIYVIFFSLADTAETEHLLALEGAKERLKLFKADLLEECSFEQAIEGCDAVFHTASPVKYIVTDPQVCHGNCKKKNYIN